MSHPPPIINIIVFIIVSVIRQVVIECILQVLIVVIPNPSLYRTSARYRIASGSRLTVALLLLHTRSKRQCTRHVH